MNDIKSLEEWSKTIPALQSEDEKRTEKLLSILTDPSLEDVKDQFYRIANMPLQTICTVGKTFGGRWLSKCGALDGNKYVCLDKLYDDIASGNCLIYSFGIAEDWSFEEAMAEQGCTIRAFDPTIEESSKPNSDLENMCTFN